MYLAVIRPLKALWADANHGPLPALLLVLTVATGSVDAVSVLRLGRVFVANMTGNIVFVGFAVAKAPGFSLSASLFALAGFLAGAACGGQLASHLGRDRLVLLRSGVAIEIVLVVTALSVSVAIGAPLTDRAKDGIAALTALAMGIQNSMARRLAVPDLTTTVLTMTLTGIVTDWHGPNRGPAMQRRILAVITMLGGAVAGAELVLHLGPTAGLSLVTGLLAVVAAGSGLAARDSGTWRAG